MNFELIIESLFVSFVPLLVFFAVLFILVPEMKFTHGLLSCFLGLLAVIPICVIQFWLDSKNLAHPSTMQGFFLMMILAVGVTEEFVKMILLLGLPVKKMELPDFFSCSLLAGFSVGCFESLLYTVSGISSIGIRLFTAVILHSFCAGLSGIFIYSLKHKCLQVMPFIFAVLFHGIYDYFVSLDSSSFFYYFSFLVILISIVECRAGYTKVKYILLKREEPPVNPSAATVVEEKAYSGKSKKLTSKSFSRSTVSGRKSKTSSSKIDSSKVGTFEKKSVSPKRK